MTHEQFDRWQDFALRMARTCYRNARRPNGNWIVEVVEDFFDLFDEDEAPSIVNWDHSKEYPEGHQYRRRECHDSYCGCGGYRLEHDNRPNPKCSECYGIGHRQAWCEGPLICDSVTKFLDGYIPREPECKACSAGEQSNARVQHWRCFIDRKPNDQAIAEYLDRREAKEDADAALECRCEAIRELFYEQWDEQYGGPIRCCIRAGLDCASAPSAGVVGFTAGDVRRMYPEGVPDWVFPPDERLKFWLTDELDGTFAELPDSAGVVL